MSAQLVLTRRDCLILVWVYQYHGVSVDLIHRRFFADSKSPRACYRRIKYLVEQAYLVAQRLPSSNGVGSGKLFVTVGSKAKPLVAQHLGLSQAELSRQRAESPRWIEHHLALCSTRLAFELAAEQSRMFTLADWTSDREVIVRIKDAQTKTELVASPDSTLTLALPGGTEQKFYIEMDMGTLRSAKRMRIRLRTYLLAARTAPVPGLFITTSESRLEAIAHLASLEAQELKLSPKVIWLTTRDQLNDQTVLDASIWTIVGAQQRVALSSLVPPLPDDALHNGTQRSPADAAPALGIPQGRFAGSFTFAGGLES